MTAFNYIAEARAIRTELSSDLATWKTRIDEAIATGSTGTEILMSLRWNLAKLLEANPALPPELITRIKDYLVATDKLLS
jgi:hypothetical protein